MSAPTHRRGNLFVVTLLLLLCILFEQYGIAPFFPMVDAAGSFRPMIVFLDIPLPLPAIDWLPVSLLFAVFYSVIISRTSPKGDVGKRVWKALTGWWIFIGCVAAGGGTYYLIQDYVSQQVANGIDSFGLRADLTLPYPSGELIHLHGSVVQLLFALLGLHLMMRRLALPQPVVERSVESGAAAVAEAQAIIDTPVGPKTTVRIIKKQHREPVLADEPEMAVAQKIAPATKVETAQKRSSVAVMPPARTGPAFPGEPPTCRLTTPPPIAVVMPRAAPGIGKAHPCFVIGGLKPIKPARI